MKKIVSLLLAVCMLVAILAGCGNKPTSDAANPSQETSTGKEETSNSTTESTQATDTEETTVPAQESATTPSEENSTKPTEKPIEPTNPTETTKPVHTHSYSAATCTQAKKCSCGATSGSSLGHKWTNATCTTPKTCSVCKVTEGNAAGHSWSNATCTTPKTCSVCKATEGNAAGHSWSNATCTTPKTCSVCKATEGNAAGHSWSDATCTTPKTCSICKLTEGSKVEHIVEGTTCKMCGRVVAVDPNNFNPKVNYICAGNVGPRVSEYSGVTYNLFSLTYLGNDKKCYSDGGYVQSNPHADWPQVNGTYYGPTAEWNCQCEGLNGMWSYQIVGTEIVITAEVNYEGNKNAILHCQLLSDGSLKVISLSGTTIPTEAGIKVGSIFYPTTYTT